MAATTDTQRVDVERWPKECDWLNDREFSVHDEPGEHDPCYLVMPGGSSVAFAHHATNGVDQARATFIANACNQYAALADEVERWRRTGIRIIDGDAKLERDHAALLQQLAEKDEALRVADLFQQLVIGEGAWERFQDLTKRAESAESKLAEQAAEIERLGECLRVFICDCQQWSYDSLDTEGGKRIALEWMTRYNGNKRRAEAAERAREEAEQDRWRTDWPEMTPVSDRPPSLWRSERVIVSLVGGRVTHDVAESFEGKRPLWFIHRDKVRAWQPFPAAFLAANGGR